MAEKKEAPKEQAGNKKKLFIIIGAAVLVLLIGVGTAAFFLMKKAPEPEKKEEHATEAQAPEGHGAAGQAPAGHNVADIGPMVDIDEFIVNIISGDAAHYVKASLTIELTNPEVKTEADKRMPQMRDAILLLVGNKTYEELQDLQGKKQLKAEIISKINSFLKSGKVKDVYFTNFVVQ